MDEGLSHLVERMDERFDRVDERFGRVDERFDRVESEMKAGFERADAENKLRFKGIDQRLDRADKEMKEGFARVDGDIKELRVEIKELHADNKAMLQAMNQGFTTIYRVMFIGMATIVAALIGLSAV